MSTPKKQMREQLRAAGKKMTQVRNPGIFARYPELRALFLKHLARYGNPAAAAKHVRLSMPMIVEYQKRYQQFEEEYQSALAEHHAKIDRAIHDRAIEGWEEPRFGQSGLLGTVRRYSDTLLLAYARRHMKEYRETSTTNIEGKVEVEHTHKVDLNLLTGAQRDALRLLLGREEETMKPAMLTAPPENTQLIGEQEEEEEKKQEQEHDDQSESTRMGPDSSQRSPAGPGSIGSQGVVAGVHPARLGPA